MTRALVLLGLMLLSACGSSTSLPAPRIVDINPASDTVGRTAPIQLEIEAAFPIRLDYAEGEVETQGRTRVWIGEQEARVIALNAQSLFAVDLPANLGVAAYDVRVALADGRETTSPQGFTLVSPDAGPDGIPDGGVYVADGGPEPEPDAGQDPTRPMGEGDITGYEFETISDQDIGQPFAIIVRAVGPRAADFTDKVDLSISKNNGNVSPTSLDKFVGGICVQNIAIDAQGANVVLTVTDRFGVQSSSNAFKVK
ncbi:Copper-binding protein CopC (methionine-rich) [Myxococcus fulvus]|uniref:Copper-binding protein CopC (Methionine-rich) n=1 Tax=Myxococcus fulvus TaxID=33 RepID=A0A511TH72_MYXFU|nr:hypothetical protein [Myxococcus fulvus]GEN12548.1 hypothetical protein MFU01_75850 [Myxococcus fulvus]SET85522.1 Copper-binding protein CopC (methionine-rich) [Myxococcus fulvus]